MKRAAGFFDRLRLKDFICPITQPRRQFLQDGPDLRPVALAQSDKIPQSLLRLAECRNDEPVAADPLHRFNGIDALDLHRC